MFDLPAHLSNLNAIASPPSNALNTENEDAFWDFMHTDQLFENFGGVSPAAHDAKEELQRSVQPVSTPAILAPAPTPAPTLAGYAASPPTGLAGFGTGIASGSSGQTLEAFLAQFVADQLPLASSSTPAAAGYRLPLSLPLPYSSAATPSGAVDTADIIPRNSISMAAFDAQAQADADEAEAERISGAKKLKLAGAGVAEIEEDKRRRNTEASARFRAKKKEREQALEGRAKVLEAQVAQLIADKSSLENENKLLKAIVLGSGQGGAEQLQGALAALGAKRKRDD